MSSIWAFCSNSFTRCWVRSALRTRAFNSNTSNGLAMKSIAPISRPFTRSMGSLMPLINITAMLRVRASSFNFSSNSNPFIPCSIAMSSKIISGFSSMAFFNPTSEDVAKSSTKRSPCRRVSKSRWMSSESSMTRTVGIGFSSTMT